jgi:hypothetical protein
MGNARGIPVRYHAFISAALIDICRALTIFIEPDPVRAETIALELSINVVASNLLSIEVD